MDQLMISPGNAVFWGLAAIFIFLLAAASVLLKGKSERLRAVVLSAAMAGTFILYWYYKWQISMDAEYAALRASLGLGTGTFTWWDELPLQLCNINILLIPLAVWGKKRPLLSFCFFMAPLGALMALLMPIDGFSECSLLIPRVWGYYVTHFLVLIGGVAVMTFGFYRPRFSDILPGVGMILGISFLVFLINLLLRVTGLNPHANYFFNMNTEGNALLELVHGLLPLPYLYQIPLVLIVGPYMLLLTAFLQSRTEKRG